MVKKGKLAKQAIEEKKESEERKELEGESTPGGHAQGLETDDSALERAQKLGLHTEETFEEVDKEPTLADEAREAIEDRELPPELSEENVEEEKETWRDLSPFQAFLEKLGIKGE